MQGFLFPTANFGFNPRPHAEGDKYWETLPGDKFSFNPRPHAEGDIFDSCLS